MHRQILRIEDEQRREIGSCRVPNHEQFTGVAAVLRDVALDPRYRGRDVLDVRGMHHAGREAVVHDDGDVTGGRKPLPDEGLFRLVPLPQPAAVNRDDDRGAWSPCRAYRCRVDLSCRVVGAGT